MKVKICGLTNKDDATWALNYGADFLGINFFKDSPRHCSMAIAKKWVPYLPSFANVVGVFVNMEPKEILHHVLHLNLKGIQLSGEETPDVLKDVKEALRGTGRSTFVMKSIRIKDEESLATIPPYIEHIDYLLLDSYVPGEMGGTGTRFNWALAVQAKEYGKPVFLAGGLTAENVREAIKKVQPFAVDVASGVEKSPRKKDPDKIKSFINNARA